MTMNNKLSEQEPYQEKREKPWGYEIIYTKPGLPYAGKILSVLAGSKLSLQYHDKKQETIMLLEGRALLWLGDSPDAITKISMDTARGYDIEVGKIHRLEAISDCLFLEASTPEGGTTYRIEDDYQRDNETR